VLIGEVTNKLVDYAVGQGITKENIIFLGEIEPNSVYKMTYVLCAEEAVVIGIGNMAGQRNYGASIADHFASLSAPE
jgi:hypothetical protein